MGENIPKTDDKVDENISTADVTDEDTQKSFSKEEVEAHNTKTDIWIIIRDKVYDVTKFIDEHPGGEDVLIEVAGKDATSNFEEVGHSSSAQELMQKYYIGDLLTEVQPVEGEGVVAFTACFKSFKSIKSKFGFK